MKRYWKMFKIVLVLVIAIGAIFWAAGSVRSLSYSGTNLTFPVGNGAVTVTNPSNQPVPVQLISTGSRSFSVSSTIEGLSGSSTTQGTGTATSQLVEFVLPPGVSEITVVRRTNVTTEVDFVANTEIKLEVAAQPLNTNDTRTTIIVAVVVVFGALFYISRATGIRWISASRRKEESDQAAGQLAERQAFKRRFRRVTSEKS
jgi:preprotein translocase subunit SecE